MSAIAMTVKPLVLAFVISGLGVLAFGALVQAGFATETSLIAALILAGVLNIGASASLNGEGLLPTSGMPVGDLSS